MMKDLRGELTDLKVEKKSQGKFSLKNNEIVKAVTEILNVQDKSEQKEISDTIMPLVVNSVTSSGCH